MRKLFTSESVTEGHPDKLCDFISDSVLDSYFEKDPFARVACETVAGKGQVVVTGTHFVVTATQWAQYIADGGSVDADGNLTQPYYIFNYLTDEPMEVSVLQMVPRANPIIAYMEATEAIDLFIDPTLPSYYIDNPKGRMPIVIAPNISISQENIYDWNNKWGGNTYGLVNTTGQLWNKTMNEPETRSGTVVKTVTATNPQKIFTSSQLASIFGVTAMSGTITAYLMNGDHAAQGADIIATYIQSGEVYARFSTTPTAGNYRFNYTISRY